VPHPLPRLLVLLVFLPAAGCGSEPPAAANTSEPGTHPSLFDPARCGRIEGRVSWAGPIPDLPSFLHGIPKKDGTFDMRMRPNPNRPEVDADSRGVANAIVLLRGVDLVAAKPWEPIEVRQVRVEMTDCNIAVRQGDSPPRRVGFVRRGDSVQITATDPFFHALRGRGAAFFTYTFPAPAQPRRRTFDTVGRVELSSAAGFYWASADLFVDDHPNYTLTDSHGCFALDHVPAGKVEVVVWMPNWNVTKQERDPESGLIARQTYAPPIEHRQPLQVEAGATRHADFVVP
jgi:hypothetical protein